MAQLEVGSPQSHEVNAFHDNDDVDSAPHAHHHTLGGGGNQAAPGNHTHPEFADITALGTRMGDAESAITHVEDLGWEYAIPGTVSSNGSAATKDSTTGVVTVPAGCTLLKLDSLFVPGYEYEITLDMQIQSGHSTDNSAWIRMREGGVANSAAAYQTGGSWGGFNGAGGVYSVNGGNIGAIGAVSGSGSYVDFTTTIKLRPWSSNKVWFYSFESFTGGSARGVRAGGYTPSATTFFDGIEFWFNGAQTGLAQGKVRARKRKLA